MLTARVQRGARDGLLVLSPHFDDALMSCGELIGSFPGIVVATVCSASPGAGVPASPEWDALPGFDTADAAVFARREEDRRALAILGAVPAYLGLVDELYRRSVGWDEVVEELSLSVGALLDELTPRCCFLPIGLGGGASDHELTREAAVGALLHRPWCHAVAYAELPYRLDNPGRMEERLGQLQQALVRPFAGPHLPGGTKERAVRCYETQIGLLRTWEKVIEPDVERYFHLRLHSSAPASAGRPPRRGSRSPAQRPDRVSGYGVLDERSQHGNL